MSRMRQKRKARALEREAEERRAQGDVATAEDAAPASDESDAAAAEGDDSGTAAAAEGDDSEAGAALSDEKLRAILEALIFVSNGPLPLARIAELVPEAPRDRITAQLAALEESFAERGLCLGQVSGGYQFRTHPQVAPWVQKLVAGKPVRLSRAQLETLSIIAYRQPITRPEIDEIRGVDSGGTLRVLLERQLIRVLGKREEPGRPLLYGTTRGFLELFNLESLAELPTLREYHELTDDSLREIEKLDAENGKAAEADEDGEVAEADEGREVAEDEGGEVAEDEGGEPVEAEADERAKPAEAEA